MDFSVPKGMRDFLPQEMREREEVIDSIRSTFRLYGYAPFDTPAVEKMETLQRKGGEEIEGQIFKIEGGLGLRFDLTVPLARVCGGKQFSLPFKRYAIAPVWRREEPQKGRFREFYQADIDVVGSASAECEAELLACANECLERLGFANAAIKINSRKVLDALCEKIGVGEEKKGALMRSLDKIGKLDGEEIRKEMERKGIGKQEIDGVFGFIEGAKGNEKALAKIREIGTKKALEAESELSAVLCACKDYGITPQIDLSLVRGLAYYTGTVFEIKLSEDMGSVAGGGRYDSLISLFGKRLPAVGISLGIERLIALLREKRKESKGAPYTKVFVACVNEKARDYARKAAGELRSRGICTEIDLMGRN
ncbi:histidine--tRNA ligase, partial [Candidatus Micrarchaeota archaeon CG11_big_fil_rev_8_21_14_0_20_47_5]